MSASKNKIFQTTSFLSKSNSSYVEEMYEKFCNNPSDILESWRQYFEGINETHNIIKKELSGPSWSPKKIKSISDIDLDIYEKFIPENLNHSIQEKIEKEKPLNSAF